VSGDELNKVLVEVDWNAARYYSTIELALVLEDEDEMKMEY